MNLARVADQLKQPEILLPAVESFVRNAGGFSDQEVQETVADVASICRGTLPVECEYGHFESLCWLADTVGEKLAVPGFELFNNYEYLERIGIWQLLTETPPITLPKCTALVPSVGFATNSHLRDVIHPKILALCDVPAEPDVILARQNLEEVIESISLEGELDLLAVLL